MGTEQRTTGDPRIMPGIGEKDEVSDPFAIRIGTMFANLRAPLEEIDPGIGLQNRLIRNAGIRAEILRVKVLGEDQNEIKKRYQLMDQEYEVSEALSNLEASERLTEDQKKEQRTALERKTARIKRKMAESLLAGNLSEGETRKRIKTIQRLIPNSLLVKGEIREQLNPEDELTIEELICLSYIDGSTQHDIYEKAIGYLKNEGNVGKIILENCEQYFLNHTSHVMFDILDQEHGAQRLP